MSQNLCPHPYLLQHAVIDGKPVFHCGRCSKVVGQNTLKDTTPPGGSGNYLESEDDES